MGPKKSIKSSDRLMLDSTRRQIIADYWKVFEDRRTNLPTARVGPVVRPPAPAEEPQQADFDFLQVEDAPLVVNREGRAALLREMAVRREARIARQAAAPATAPPAVVAEEPQQ